MPQKKRHETPAQLDKLYKRWLNSPVEECECHLCRRVLSFREWHEQHRLCDECNEGATDGS